MEEDHTEGRDDGDALPHPRPLLWFLPAAAVPVLAALVITLRPVAEPPNDQTDVASTAFVLKRDSTGPAGDSLESAYVKADRLLTVLRAEEAFLKAMLSQSSNREAALWIDLRDSVAVISIQGVPVRSNRIESFEKSVQLDQMRAANGGMDSLSIPFELREATANIPHIPMRVVHAPKDTAEARLKPPDAFVAEEGRVRARLVFNRNVVVQLDPIDGDEGWLQSLAAELSFRGAEALTTLKASFGSHPEPPPVWIRLRMDSHDIRAIYRALQVGGRMAVRW